MRKLFFCSALLLVCSYLPGQNSWAIRPELQVNFMKSSRYSNTMPFDGAVPVAERYPNFMVFAERYKGVKSKWSFGLGYYNTFFSIGHPGAGSNLFFEGGSSSGTSGGAMATATYSRNVLPADAKSRLYIGAGANLWYKAAERGGASNPIFNMGGFVGTSSSTTRLAAFNYGLNGSINFWWGNKRGREVMQFLLRYNLGIRPMVQHTLAYNARLTNDAGQTVAFDNQSMQFRLNGSSVQFGISKTIAYFPRQRKQTAAPKQLP